MYVVCNDNTSLFYTIEAIRTCWDSTDKMDSETNGITTKLGPKDEELLRKIVFQHKHHSTLEHIVYNFSISGISRGCLQELARHRIASYSVKSTRYTLKELKDADIDKCWKTYLVQTGVPEIDNLNIQRLREIQSLLNNSTLKLDYLKYLVPEAYKTELSWTINARALRNFLELRTSKSAHWEIRTLANKILETLPSDHRIIFEDFYEPNTVGVVV